MASRGHGGRVCVSDTLCREGGTDGSIMVPTLGKDPSANKAGAAPGSASEHHRTGICQGTHSRGDF